ncbi:MAG: hypothetical protein ACI8PB_000785 [Desulforhopalus sp.]|jgi:hypothetical protein
MQVNLLSPVLLSHSIFTEYIMPLSLTQLSLFISGGLGVVILVKYISVMKKNKLLSTKLSETASMLEKQEIKINDMQFQSKDNKTFQNSIDNAELTTRFQSTRLKAAHTSSSENSSFHAPEKYSYIRTLSEKGMDSDEIAALLSISPHEASQLVTLAMISPAKHQN